MQHLRLTTLMTVFTALVVLLAFVPGQAAAGICATLGLPEPCILKEDVAAKQIRGAFHMNDKSIRGAQMGTGAVVRRVLKTNAVNGAKVQDGSLSGADIADGSLTEADIAPALLSRITSLESALAVGNVAGTYTGKGSETEFACQLVSDDGTFGFDVTVVLNQDGSVISGTATQTSPIAPGFSITSTFNGTVFPGGHASGTFTTVFPGGTSSGNFQGTVAGNTLSFNASGQDTSGDTCRFFISLLATRPAP